MRNIKKGFTLIELLIVVAIIAILAAIAVPNFLEAQVRAKVSRCQADMRTLATALTTYKIDTNKWIPDATEYGAYTTPAIGCNGMNDPFVFGKLTTPIAYLTSIPIDGFQGTTKAVDDAGNGVVNNMNGLPYYLYYGQGGWIRAICDPAINNIDPGLLLGEWEFCSPGPDKTWSYGEWNIVRTVNFTRMYDASNGTVSYGDVVRFGP